MEDGTIPEDVKPVRKQSRWLARKMNGQFATKPLTVNERQFKALQAWGRTHGVTIERYRGGGGRRRKEGTDGQD